MVYSDVSASAMEMLKRMMNGKGRYVVADAARLPFEKRVFFSVICSEVLEHILDDRAGVGEINRVTKTGGALVATFPHRGVTLPTTTALFIITGDMSCLK